MNKLFLALVSPRSQPYVRQRRALVAILAITVSATPVCAQAVTHVEETITLAPHGHDARKISCPPGFIPDGVRTNLFHTRFIVVQGQAADLQVYSPAGDRTLSDVVRLTCVKG
jgi:hypothetical protein